MPLWAKFADMTPAEREAERAEEHARLDAGTMSIDEFHERLAAWAQADEFNAFYSEQAAITKAERAEAAAQLRKTFRAV